GYFVDEVVELLVLPLEELVQVVELGTDHVPVKVAGLGVQHVLVGEERGQELDDAVPVRVGQTDIRLHGRAPFSVFGCIWALGRRSSRASLPEKRAVVPAAD